MDNGRRAYTPDDYTEAPKCVSMVKTLLTASAILFSILLYPAYAYVLHLTTPPPSFPTHTPITIEEGARVTDIGANLKEQGVIRSQLLFRALLLREGSDTGIQAGVYTFPTPLTLNELERALTAGQYLSPLARVTFPEGFRVRDMELYINDTISGTVDTSVTDELEGYLFPDTYFIPTTMDYAGLITLMKKTYEEKVAPLRPLMEAEHMSEHDVIVLASILEREANDETSMRTVAGILEKRLNEGMPLQVDATFEYIFGKASHELTVDDLETDSPFNTYTHTGLPPSPIANPGLTAIHAVLEPIPTDYLYYLTDSDGVFHYAETFEEHKKNKERYLR